MVSRSPRCATRRPFETRPDNIQIGLERHLHVSGVTRHRRDLQVAESLHHVDGVVTLEPGAGSVHVGGKQLRPSEYLRCLHGHEVVHRRESAAIDTPQLSKRTMAAAEPLIDIDDPVADYLPFFEVQYPSESSETITIRHLLNHSSGLRNNVPEIVDWVHFDGDPEWNQTELIVAMLEAGYETTMTPKALRDAVGVVLRNGPKRFKSQGGKWSFI